jgi:hypothetical protein
MHVMFRQVSRLPLLAGLSITMVLFVRMYPAQALEVALVVGPAECPRQDVVDGDSRGPTPPAVRLGP